MQKDFYIADGIKVSLGHTRNSRNARRMVKSTEFFDELCETHDWYSDITSLIIHNSHYARLVRNMEGDTVAMIEDYRRHNVEEIIERSISLHRHPIRVLDRSRHKVLDKYQGCYWMNVGRDGILAHNHQLCEPKQLMLMMPQEKELVVAYDSLDGQKTRFFDIVPAEYGYHLFDGSLEGQLREFSQDYRDELINSGIIAVGLPFMYCAENNESGYSCIGEFFLQSRGFNLPLPEC